MFIVANSPDPTLPINMSSEEKHCEKVTHF